MRAPSRPLNPFLRQQVERSNLLKTALALAAGYPAYTTFFDTLHSAEVRATPLVVTRLRRVADLVGFNPDEIFLDEAAS